MRPFLGVLSLSNHRTTEGLVLIKAGVYLMLCIGINSAATIFCVFLTMFLSGRYYHCCTIFCTINEEIAS